MAIITPTTSSNILTNAHTTPKSLTLLSPALQSPIYLASILPRLLSTTTLFLLFRTYVLSLYLLQQSFRASHLLLIQACYTSSVLGKHVYWTGKQMGKMIWRRTEKMRRNLMYEFMVFMLGSGNAAILVVFWPGWIVVWGGIWAVAMVCG